MPYISQEKRNANVENLINLLYGYFTKALETHDFGTINYILSKAIWLTFEKMPSYNNAREIKSVFYDIIHEFNRRKVDKYEDKKLKENGDII